MIARVLGELSGEGFLIIIQYVINQAQECDDIQLGLLDVGLSFKTD